MSRTVRRLGPDAAVRLSFHGAAGTVTGSCHLLEVEGLRILLDAGMFQGLKRLRLRNREAPGFDVPAVDHVVVSHTHLDHVGRLPRLVRYGLRAPIHCTPAAHDLMELTLLDAAHIQEEDARYHARKRSSRHKPPRPLYTTDDARRALGLRAAPHRYGTWFDLGTPDGGGAPRVRARFHQSGHLLGAAFVEL
ncbi:MAG: MBL fold metallo-hydrolase [Acidobacteriota bacterium]